MVWVMGLREKFQQSAGYCGRYCSQPYCIRHSFVAIPEYISQIISFVVLGLTVLVPSFEA